MFWNKAKRHFKSGAVPIDGFKCDNNIIADPIEMCLIAKSHYEAQFFSHPLDHSEIEAEAEENTSYSAMLNIPEPVPLTEPIPSNS
ncbi:unnamed protein product [Rotaria socialis]|uniref:Uncharacterized protein n=1 Tax=Rotaria socialis TaxID=392032 RepID=A0A820RUD7_9BILA|nr:unnamed protein product [Rotaria socialis]CAF4447499.1 unnamed protein product [Rotaria socialis]